MSKWAKVLWFTGLSGSGKSTLADKLVSYLKNKGQKASIFDGDTIREELHKTLDFSPEGIKENNRLIVKLCKKHQAEYDYILVSVIAPFTESRKNARKILGDDYVEIYVKASLDSVIKRDVKGLYKKALVGQIDNFIGVSINVSYQEPENPDILVDTDVESEEESFEIILKQLFKNE